MLCGDFLTESMPPNWCGLPITLDAMTSARTLFRLSWPILVVSHFRRAHLSATSLVCFLSVALTSVWPGATEHGLLLSPQRVESMLQCSCLPYGLTVKIMLITHTRCGAPNHRQTVSRKHSVQNMCGHSGPVLFPNYAIRHGSQVDFPDPERQWTFIIKETPYFFSVYNHSCTSPTCPLQS